jgi:transmembrane sensor
MEKLFKKYLQSVSTPGEFKEIAHWISKKENERLLPCPIKSSWDKYMQEESGEPLNYDLWEKIKLAIGEEEKSAMMRRLRIYNWGLRVAAVLVIALLITNLFFIRRSTPHGQIEQMQTIAVPYGARSNLSLPDGSQVWLNSGSTLTFGTTFGKERSVLLEGEAFFKVIKKDAPFIVSTSMGKVRVAGTAFNVKTISGENLFETTVEKGEVIVTQNHTQIPVSLTSGQQARLHNGQMDLTKVETELYTSWKEGKIIFRKEFLPAVAKRLEYWYNVKIELADDPRLQKIHYTGTLEMESFSEVMELLKITAPISYTYNNKTRVIKIIHR